MGEKKKKSVVVPLIDVEKVQDKGGTHNLSKLFRCLEG
jgi:hypothetical protein